MDGDGGRGAGGTNPLFLRQCPETGSRIMLSYANFSLKGCVTPASGRLRENHATFCIEMCPAEKVDSVPKSLNI